MPKPNKNRNQKNQSNHRKPQQAPKKPKIEKPSVVYFKEGMNVADLATAMKVSNAVIIKKLMMMGMMTSVNQVIDRDTIELICMEEGIEVQDEVITDVSRYDEMDIEDDPKDLIKRPPIVTIMGHVDHGKTTLLDAIRKTRVVEGEAGGITQHIGAYQIDLNGEKITFIDTPGHAAFTEMRARGAKVTDIVVLVVAADDGVMPQTVEAIDHAKNANVPLIVAINKMDRPGANPDKIMTALTERGLTPEEWGGNTPFVKISALKGEGLDGLLEIIVLVSEVEELKANPKRLARGNVIEARLDKGRGPVATLIVESGTLRNGDFVAVGNTYGKIRTMEDDLGKRFKSAPPSTPVEVTGLNEVPLAGDMFVAFDDEKTTRQIASERKARMRELELKKRSKSSLDKLLGDMESSEKELNLIIKADVNGSIEALKGLLEKMNIEGFHVNIIRSDVGAISENDVTLAMAANAIIIGFNVRPTGNVKSLADQEGIEIRLYSIIYRVQEDIEDALKGMLAPKFEEIVIGQAEVRETYKISKIGTIAGCYVTDGSIIRDSLVRVLRNGVVIYEGQLASLKRFKDDAKEVRQGFECGLSIENFDDIKVGDVIEASNMKQVEVD
ncbi:MAG: translation initiation factor IF-2 [Acholeplasmataceae bacterium]